MKLNHFYASASLGIALVLVLVMAINKAFARRPKLKRLMLVATGASRMISMTELMVIDSKGNNKARASGTSAKNQYGDERYTPANIVDGITTDDTKSYLSAGQNVGDWVAVRLPVPVYGELLIQVYNRNDLNEQYLMDGHTLLLYDEDDNELKRYTLEGTQAIYSFRFST